MGEYEEEEYRGESARIVPQSRGVRSSGFWYHCRKVGPRLQLRKEKRGGRPDKGEHTVDLRCRKVVGLLTGSGASESVWATRSQHHQETDREFEGRTEKKQNGNRCVKYVPLRLFLVDGGRRIRLKRARPIVERRREQQMARMRSKVTGRNRGELECERQG